MKFKISYFGGCAKIPYKEDVDDIRESPSLELMEILIGHDALVEYYDPFVPVIPPTREHAEFAGMTSIDWSLDKIAGYDAILIATRHSAIDYQEMTEHAKLVIDTRNASKTFPDHLKQKVVKC